MIMADDQNHERDEVRRLPSGEPVPTLGKERFEQLRAAVKKKKEEEERQREHHFGQYDDDCPLCRGEPLPPEYLAQLQYEIEHELVDGDFYEWLNGLAEPNQAA
ncbi:hypothetical protein [Novosphingobium album (ex Hu et al. 2023)]|uniref:Uncharacterized protein n=1 Tax=Novosphingobium album (ex Hu et al. 2023) TaxID=2930093 RepID=A0ABT0B6V5_9SPHN|nr:hypothetical protein [Novosphingobium album (ex Hu et al. 2023)]MCJ2180601.1 hypothetical protein [Novosphingobium album (ex Hu et al. 2023)]